MYGHNRLSTVRFDPPIAELRPAGEDLGRTHRRVVVCLPLQHLEAGEHRLRGRRARGMDAEPERACRVRRVL